MRKAIPRVVSVRQRKIEEEGKEETKFLCFQPVVGLKAIMDLAVAWFQEEQEGEAKRIWSNIWETTEMEFQQQQLLQQQQANNGNNSDTKSNDSNTSNNNFPVEKTFNPTRRKGSDNKASTYNMNKYQAKLVGKHGGCPWRPPNFQYARGIIG